VYDQAGRPVSVTKAAGTTCNTYDVEGRLVADKARGDSTASSYTYDPNGQLLTATNTTGSNSYHLNEAGQVIDRVDSYGAEQENILDADDNTLTRRVATTSLATGPVYSTTYGYDVRDRLPSIRDFSTTWQINWNVVRDGFQQAQTLGIIRMHPRAGAFVADFDYQQLAELFTHLVALSFHQLHPLTFHLYDARLVIEVEAVRRAAHAHTPQGLIDLQQRLLAVEQAAGTQAFVETDEAFHLAIADVSGNPVLATMLSSILAFLRPARLSAVRTEAQIAMTHTLHRELFQAILAGDADRAGALIADHLSRPKLRMIEELYQLK
jgi:YD repeat-containing protein